MVLNMAYTTQPYLRHYVKVWLATTIQKRDNKKQQNTSKPKVVEGFGRFYLGFFLMIEIWPLFLSSFLGTELFKEHVNLIF